MGYNDLHNTDGLEKYQCITAYNATASLIQLAMLNIEDMNAQTWSPDGHFLAMTINGKAEVYCWDTKNWAVFHSYAVAGPGTMKLSGLAWSPDSQRDRFYNAERRTDLGCPLSFFQGSPLPTS